MHKMIVSVLLIAALAASAYATCASNQQVFYASSSPQSMTSDNYPGNYAHHQFCRFVFAAPLGKRIQITFNSFQIERNYDKVFVCDGAYCTTSANSLNNWLHAMMTGSIAHPPTLVSSTSTLGMIFSTDSSVNDRGFSITYQYVSGSVCGEAEFAGIQGNIQSPNYGNGYYPNNLNCQYTINAPPENFDTQLTFSTDSSTEACCDTVKIFNHDNSNNNTYAASRAGSSWAPYMTNAGAYLTFKTDHSVNAYAGWHVHYTLIQKGSTNCGCGNSQRTLTDHELTSFLVSPNYPTSNYCNNTDCQWTLHVPSGYHAFLRFDAFDLEQGFDSVSIFDGPNDHSTLLEKCTGSSCNAITGSSNVLTVVFRSDYSNERTGFEATWGASSTMFGRDGPKRIDRIFVKPPPMKL